MRISKSLWAAVAVGASVFAASPASADQRVVVIAAHSHSAFIHSTFIGASTGSPCLPTNVLVEPCRDWYGVADDSADQEWPVEHDQYGLSYRQIGPYRYYD
ncbi:MAG: hypothetical protein ACR2PI_26310 [Hyphomicrobiaceae bacterium]